MVARRGVHGEARRFIDREDKLILVDDAEFHGRERLFKRRPDDEDGLAVAHAIAWPAARAVFAIGRGADNFIGASAGEARDAALNKAIEALPGLLSRDRKAQDDRIRIAALWEGYGRPRSDIKELIGNVALINRRGRGWRA